LVAAYYYYYLKPKIDSIPVDSFENFGTRRKDHQGSWFGVGFCAQSTPNILILFFRNS
jgi:hypothetical protein